MLNGFIFSINNKEMKKDFDSCKIWCGREDLNLHTRRALPPQGSVSTVPPLPRRLDSSTYYQKRLRKVVTGLYRHNLNISLD